MSSPNTQPVIMLDFKPENIIFGQIVKGQIPNSKLEFNKIPLMYRNADGTIGDLVLPTEKVFSYGVEEEEDFSTKEKKGTYKMSLALWSPQPTEEQKKLQDPKNLKPHITTKLPFKTVDGKKVVTTQFYDADDNDIDYKTIEGKKVHLEAAVKIEDIFMNSKLFSIRPKMLEAEIELQENNVKRLLRKKKVVKKEPEPAPEPVVEQEDSSSSEEENAEAIEESSSEEEPEPAPEPVKPAPKGRGRAAKK